MASAQTPQPRGRCSRRGFLQRTGATAGAVGAIAAGGHKVAPRYAPVGRAAAIPPAVPAALAAGAIAGIAYAEWQSPDTDFDPDGVVEDQVYSAAQSAAQGRSAFMEEMEFEYLDDEAPSSPFERSAWQAVRAEVARGAVNGESVSDITQEAQTAVRRQAAIAMINLIERWNTLVTALMDQIVIQLENGVDVLRFASSSSSDIEPLEEDELEGVPVDETASDEYEGYPVWEYEVELPVSLNEIEQRDEPLKSYLISGYTHSIRTFSVGSSRFVESTTGLRDYNFVAQHSDLDDVLLCDFSKQDQIFDRIDDEMDQVLSGIGDYVDAVHGQIQQGEIDPAHILSSQDIVDQFAGSENIDRVAAELTAIGATVPDEWTFRAEISHPDLYAETLWGILMPEFSGDEAPSIRPGTTIDAEDYRMAYFAYEGQADGSAQVELLSGDEPIEVLDLDGLEGQETLDESDTVAGENGEVVLWTGGDPPDPIANPSEYEGWSIMVGGETNRHVADVTDAQQEGDDWILPDTDLEEGETIEYVEIVPSPNYTQPVDYVADPTEPDEDMLDRIQHLNETIDELEEALDDSGGGIGDWFGDMDSGVMGAAVGIIVVLGAIVGFGQITS